MRSFLRFSLLLPLALAPVVMGVLFASRVEAQTATNNSMAPASQQTADGLIPSDPRALYQSLNDLKLDGTRVYSVHDLTLQRDAIHFAFTEGTLAFLQPLGGKVTGAVFVGYGHVVATPHDPGERRSLSHFLGLPILDQTFTNAYIRFTDDTASELQREIASSGAEGVDDPAFAARWAPGLAAAAPSHSLRIMQDFLSSEQLPYFYALLQNESVGRFEVVVDPRRDEGVMIGQLRRENGMDNYDVWASFRMEGAPAKPAEHFLPVEYTVESNIADDLSLEGKTTLRLKAVSSGDRIIHLELSRNLAVSEIFGDDGKALIFFQNQDLRGQELMRRGNDTVMVVLPEAKNAGDEFHLRVSYHGSVIASAGNGVEFVGERGAWFAHIGGEHFAAFDLAFRWPKRFTLVATGTKMETHEDNAYKSGRWRSGTPFATAGFNLGEYKVASAGEAPKIQIYANKELEDAIAKRLLERDSTRIDTTTSFVHPLNGTVTTVLPTEPAPSPTAALSALAGEVVDSVQFFRRLNGPFPFDHLDVAQIPGSFGQGWPGLIYLSTLAFLPVSTQEQAGITEWAQRGSRNIMPFHEVAHQWWGNVTIAGSYRDAWIEEGLANYLSLLYSDSKKPGEHRLTGWLEHYKADLLATPAGSSESIEQTGPLTLGTRLASAKSPEAYATVIYGKGTWVIHMLREMLREPNSADPDSKFRELLQSILKEYKFQPFTTADFQRAIERDMNPAMDLDGTHRMDWFFDEWVRGIGIPHYSVKFEVKSRGQNFVVSGVLTQKGVPEAFTEMVPLYGTRVGGKPERLGVVITTNSETKFLFEARTRPTKIAIDPQMTLLCTTN